MKQSARTYSLIAAIFCLLIFSGSVLQAPNAAFHTSYDTTPTLIPRYAALLAKAKQHGGVDVIVEFSVPLRPLWALLGTPVEQKMIQITRHQILEDLSTYNIRTSSDSDWPVPFLWIYVDESALRHLMENPLITNIGENFSMPAPQVIRPTKMPSATK